MTRTSLN